LKKCSKCGELKPLDQFYVAKGGRDGRRGDCKACFAARHQRWYAGNKAKEIARVQAWRDANAGRYAEYQRQYNARPERKLADRAGHLKRKFGISLEQYEEMLAAQSGGCAICGVLPPENGSLHVDHDHETGRVRGLLCFSCNGGIGQFQEDPLILRAAVRYLDPRAAKLAKDWQILLEV
jgi:hypothetical protein